MGLRIYQHFLRIFIITFATVEGKTSETEEYECGILKQKFSSQKSRIKSKLQIYPSQREAMGSL